MPDLVQVHAETVDGGNKALYSTDDIPVTLDSDGIVFIQLDASTCAPNSSRLKAFRDYTAWIVAKNDFGESTSTGEIPFSKFVCEVLQEAIEVVHIYIILLYKYKWEWYMAGYCKNACRDS